MADKKPFTRKVEYDAIRVDYYGGDTIDLRAEDGTDVVYVGLSIDEAKELRKLLKAAITVLTNKKED